MKLEDILNQTGFEQLGGAMAEAMKKHQEQVREKLANRLVDVLKLTEEVTSLHVQSLRELRAKEKKQKDKLEEINRAVEHLKKNANPMPFFKAADLHNRAKEFCNSLGIAFPDDNDPVWKATKK